MSGARPGSWSTSTSKSSGGSCAPAIASPATGAARKYTPDGRRIGDAGWEFVHVCVDDHSRLAYAEVLSDEKGSTAVCFLRRALKFFAGHGVTVERVMTDNGAPYRSHLHALACQQLGLRHLRTQPYRPRTNGKAERFIQTLLRDGPTARSSKPALTAPRLPNWLTHYNFTRPHGATSHKTARLPPDQPPQELHLAPGAASSISAGSSDGCADSSSPRVRASK